MADAAVDLRRPRKAALLRTSIPLLYWFVVPGVFLALFLVVALVVLMQYGFRQYIPGSIEVGGFTLANFSRAARWLYVRVFLDSVRYSVITAVMTLILSYPLAYALVRSRSAALKSIILIVAISPLFTGDIVRNYGWMVVFGRNGFLNAALTSIGMISEPLEILYTPTAVVIALVQTSMPIMIIILAASLTHVDSTYERAAASLGASPARVFFRVTLSLSTPGVISGLVTIFAYTLSSFATPQLVGGGRVSMIANMVYNMGVANFDFPFAAVLSMTSLILIVGVMWALGYVTRRFERIGLN